MKIYVTNFAKYQGLSGISIANTQPTMYPEVEEFKPSWEDVELIRRSRGKSREERAKAEAEFRKNYMKQLDSIPDDKFFNLLTDGATYLCWEKFEAFCHRHLFADKVRSLPFDIEVIDY